MTHPTLDRAYIEARVSVNESSKCWEWQKSLNPQTGYGQIAGKPYTAHRLAYMLWIGDPGKAVVRHTCHNRACCNPRHLRSGTPKDNYYDSFPAHQAQWEKMRGRTAPNARPVTINGITYPSIDCARKTLRVGWRTAVRLAGASPRTGQAF